MDEETRRNYTPEEYIRALFADTANGKLDIAYYPILDSPYTLSYNVDWNLEEAESLVENFTTLTKALTRIGNMHDEAENEENLKSLLTEDEFKVWDTYIRPFEPFEENDSVIGELHLRSETETLSDEEYELLERHNKWFEANSLKRLPERAFSPAKLINRAKRYERLVSLKAPEIVIAEDGRCLAEEMLLYYYGLKQHKPDLIRFIEAQENTYSKALSEIKNGRKRTHWMWFVFPQLRGLGRSEMSYTYGLADLAEAKAYLADIILGARLIRISKELLKLNENNPEAVFGNIDAMKLKSSMTLFAYISDNDSVFHKVLDKFFDGKKDSKTLGRLALQ